MRYYLLSATVLLTIAGVLMIIGLPYAVTHPLPKGNVYGGCSYLNAHGQAVNNCNPVYLQLTLYGVIVSAVGVLMLVGHCVTKKENVANHS